MHGGLPRGLGVRGMKGFHVPTSAWAGGGWVLEQGVKLGILERGLIDIRVSQSFKILVFVGLVFFMAVHTPWGPQC